MAKAAACNSTNSVITVSDLDTTVNCEPRVQDLRLAEVLGFAKAHDIRPLIRRHISILGSFGEVTTVKKTASSQGGRPGTDYYLNKKQALFITAKSDTERAALVTVQMVEVFDAVTSGASPAITVKAHRRAAPKRLPFTPSQKGRGVMMLDHLVYFDRRILPRNGDEVLYIDQENQPRIGVVQDYPGAEFKLGRVWVEIYPRPTRTWGHLPLIGVVTTPAGKPKRLAA